MAKRGKQRLGLTEDELSKFKAFFKELDKENKGKISIHEIEEPLVTFGFCKTREEVLEIVKNLNYDEKTDLNLPEFVALLRDTYMKGDKSFLADRTILGDLRSEKLLPNIENRSRRNKSIFCDTSSMQSF